MRRCPICKNRIKREEYIENHILAEEIYRCDYCDFYEHFAYGYRESCYGDKVLVHSYTFSKKQARMYSVLYRNFIKRSRKKYRKLKHKR